MFHSPESTQKKEKEIPAEVSAAFVNKWIIKDGVRYQITAVFANIGGRHNRSQRGHNIYFRDENNRVHNLNLTDLSIEAIQQTLEDNQYTLEE